VLEDSIEAVGPHSAVRAAGAHIVNEEQRVLVPEQGGQPHLTAWRCKFVIPDFLGLDRCLSVSHLLAKLGDLSAIGGQLFGGVLVRHR
jgi:hypothetical protein